MRAEGDPVAEAEVHVPPAPEVGRQVLPHRQVTLEVVAVVARVQPHDRAAAVEPHVEAIVAADVDLGDVRQQQGLLGAFLFLVPAVILSGFATPIENMPRAVQLLTYLDPLRYFMIVLRGVFLEGSSYALLIHQYWPMAVIGLISLTLAGWLFRHRMY